MGCQVGKATPPKAASPKAEGTLLAHQSALPKEVPSESPKATQQRRPSRATMVVTRKGQLHAEYEGLARTLGVYDGGWVAGFRDVADGDTGVLLGESRFPTDSVALRLHRNGGVICIGRQGVAEAGFDGVWDHGDISGDKVTLADGTEVKARINETARLISAEINGLSYTGQRGCNNDDDKIHWNDGDVWTRLQGTAENPVTPVRPTLQLQPSQSSPSDTSHRGSGAWPESGRPEAELEDRVHTNLSTVKEESECSNTPATSPNLSGTSAHVSGAGRRISEVEREPTPPSEDEATRITKELHAAAAAETSTTEATGWATAKSRDSRGMLEDAALPLAADPAVTEVRKHRKDRGMCCC